MVMSRRNKTKDTTTQTAVCGAESTIMDEWTRREEQQWFVSFFVMIPTAIQQQKRSNKRRADASDAVLRWLLLLFLFTRGSVHERSGTSGLGWFLHKSTNELFSEDLRYWYQITAS